MFRWFVLSAVALAWVGCGSPAELATEEGSATESDASESSDGSDGEPESVGARQLWSVVGRCGSGNDVALLADGRIAVVGDGYVDDATTEASVGYVQLYGSDGEQLWDVSLVDASISPNAVAIGKDDEIVAVGGAAQGANAIALDPSGNAIAMVETALSDGSNLELVDVTVGHDGELLIVGNAEYPGNAGRAVWVGSWSLGESIDTAATLEASDSNFFGPTARSIAVTSQGIALCGYDWVGEATAVWTAAYSADFVPLWSDDVYGSDTSSYQTCSAVRVWGRGLMAAGQIEPEGGRLYFYDAAGDPIEPTPALPSPPAGELVEVVDLAANGTLLALGGRFKDYPSTGRRSWIRWHDDAHALVAETEAAEENEFFPDEQPDIRAIAMDSAGAVVAVGTLQTGGGHGCLTRVWLGKFVLE